MYADLVTAAGFKPVVASEKVPGGFDSHPLPLQRRAAQKASDGGQEGLRFVQGDGMTAVGKDL